jgi:hypothetical protein
MGSLLFDYLLDSPLFEAGAEEEAFGRISDVEISRHLRNYRDFVLKNIGPLHQEAHSNSSNLRILAPQEEVGVDLLRHLAFYVQQFLLKDPLFPLTVELREVDRVKSKLSKLELEALNRRRLVKAITYL